MIRPATRCGYMSAYCRMTGVPMLCPANTARSILASALTASTARAKSAIVNFPSFGESLLP